MSDGTCSLPECSKPVKRGGYCYGHYMKNWRYGTPTPEFPDRWVDIRGKRFGLLVVLERAGSMWQCRCDCGQAAAVRAGDLNRGAVSTCGERASHWRRTDIGYGSAHDRCRQDRGLPAEYLCVGCGRQANHWSYNHDDPNELICEDGREQGIAYSADPAHYSPRCVPCHKRFDLGRLDSANGA